MFSTKIFSFRYNVHEFRKDHFVPKLDFVSYALENNNDVMYNEYLSYQKELRAANRTADMYFALLILFLFEYGLPLAGINTSLNVFLLDLHSIGINESLVDFFIFSICITFFFFGIVLPVIVTNVRRDIFVHDKRIKKLIEANNKESREEQRD